MSPQFAMHGTDMFRVARFNRTLNADRAHIGTTEGALMCDVFNAGTRGGDDAGQLGKSAWTIADLHGESTETTIMDETLFDHTAENGWIDISTADHQHDFLSA